MTNDFLRGYKRAFAFVLTLGVFCLGGYYIFMSFRFSQSFGEYAALADEHSNAAFFVGALDNPMRQELNRILSEVLGRNMSAAERLQLAERGLALLDETEVQIDGLGTIADRVKKAIDALEAESAFGSRRELISLARERLDVIADIRGLSYRANYHTAEIFRRIARDNGELTDAHVTELNGQLPMVEEQFNERSNLYNELEQLNAEIVQTF
jgi:hypothetical protein